MARKPRQPKPEAEAPPPAQEGAMQVIPAGKFTSLCRQIKKFEADKNSAVGDIGSLISKACEKQNLEKRAFAIYRRLAKLDDSHLSTVLAHLDYYRDIGGLDQRAASQGQMFARSEAGEEDGDDDADEGESNVTKLRAAE